MRRFRISLLLPVAVALAMAALPSRADTVTFGTFTEPTSGTPFHYNSTSGVAHFYTSPDPASVNFTFNNTSLLNPAYAGLAGQTINATIGIDAYTDQAASTSTTTLFAGSPFQTTATQISQVFNGNGSPNGLPTIVVKAGTGGPIAAGTTLLSIQFTGTLSGLLNQGTASLTASTLSANIVNVTSNYFLIDPNHVRGLILGLNLATNLTTTTSGGKLMFGSFDTSGHGDFSAAVVPEPSAVLMVGLGLAAIPVISATRRRKASLGTAA